MTIDPKTAGPAPPLPRQQQDPPGFTEQLDPKPDHGEHSYRGCGKLKGRAVREFGKLDILVNNAAYQMTHASLEETSEEE